MNLKIDLRVAELMASRLCHDLVGPIGAVNNGMEILEDEDLGIAKDAVELASRSARQATDVLQLFRLAYGLAGSLQGSDLSLVRELASNYLGHHKCSLDWPPSPIAGPLPDALGKLILNLVVLAGEALPRGGTIEVALAGDGRQVAVSALGAGAGLRDETLAALSNGASAQDLSPRNVHGYVTRMVAKSLGSDLALSQVGPGHLKILVALPA